MNPNDNILNLLKKEAQNSIKLYNKTIPPSSVTLEQLIDKASEIDKKIASNKPNINDIPGNIDNKHAEHTPKHHELYNYKEHNNNNNNQYIDFDSFRKENSFVPKLHINCKKEKKRNSATSISTYNQAQAQSMSYGGIMSLYSNGDNDDNEDGDGDDDDDNGLVFTPYGRVNEEDNECGNTSVNNDGDYLTVNNQFTSGEGVNRNNVNYDKKIDPFFFTNRYVEYEYEDKGDKLYDESEVMRNLFENNGKKNKNSELYVANAESPCLRTYLDLLLLEKEENDDKNTLRREKVKYEMKPVSSEMKSKIQSEINAVNKLNLDNEYINYFLARNLNELEIAKQMAISNNAATTGGAAEKSAKDKKGSSKKKTTNTNTFMPFNKKASDVSFKIRVQGEIAKKRGNSHNEKTRGMIVEGPVVTWYGMNSSQEFETEKGTFDIRDILFPYDVYGSYPSGSKDNSNSNSKTNSSTLKGIIGGISNKNKQHATNTSNAKETLQPKQVFSNDKEEEFEVRKTIENNKVITKSTIFSSRRMLEFNNQTFKHFFIQLQQYYNDFIINIDNAPYSVLKFLSDKDCTALELNYEIANTNIINYIHWHPKLLHLSIHSSFVPQLAVAIQNRNWECRLESLSIIRGGDLEQDLENHLSTILTHYNSLSIQTLSFIDIVLTEGIYSALIEHINVFYSETSGQTMLPSYLVDSNKSSAFSSSNVDSECAESNSHLLKQVRLRDYKYNTIPFVNLAFKRNALSSDNNNKNSDEVLDLRLLYGVFIYMLYKALHFQHCGTVHEVFNCLDLSEQTVKNEEYLVRIITKFKLIKELNISNTRLETNGVKLVESPRFLRYIKLADNFDKSDVNVNNNVDKDKLYEVYEKEYDNWRNNALKNTENDLGFDNCMGVYPILERMYLYNTEIKENVSEELYLLFKRLRYFQGIYFSLPPQHNQESHLHSKTGVIEDFLSEVHRDKKHYCENVFIIDNDSHNM